MERQVVDPARRLGGDLQTAASGDRPRELVEADEPTGLEMLEDVLNLVASVAVLLLPMFILALPGVILLGLVLIPLAAAAVPLAIAGAILALPYLLVRSVRRRLRRGARAQVAEGGSPFWG